MKLKFKTIKSKKFKMDYRKKLSIPGKTKRIEDRYYRDEKPKYKYDVYLQKSLEIQKLEPQNNPINISDLNDSIPNFRNTMQDLFSKDRAAFEKIFTNMTENQKETLKRIIFEKLDVISIISELFSLLRLEKILLTKEQYTAFNLIYKPPLYQGIEDYSALEDNKLIMKYQMKNEGEKELTFDEKKETLITSRNVTLIITKDLLPGKRPSAGGNGILM